MLASCWLQVASSFLIELGNGDKFLFDLGSGSYANLIATGNYKVNKVCAPVGVYTFRSAHAVLSADHLVVIHVVRLQQPTFL